MPGKRAKKRMTRTAAELTRLREIRASFQQRRPSLEALLASGEYEQPVKQGDYFGVLELAAELKKARHARRLSLAQVANRSGIDEAAISRIENGQNLNPTIATLESIARAIGSKLTFSLENTAASAR
jgi:ribosome-binding protein aMBF1 (putative translation factor)